MENKCRRRRRENPVKKWTEKEVFLILDYILEAGKFEKPTAQIFYRKFLEHNQLKNATWELIRWKMRSLKTSFVKAMEWTKSTGSGLLETEKGVGCVQAKILKICPYYDRLKEIFGDKSDRGSSFNTYEVADFIISEEEQELVLEQELGLEPEFEIYEEQEFPNYQIELPPTIARPATPSTQANSTSGKGHLSESLKCAERLRKFAPKTAIGERQAFQEEKLKLERDKLLQLSDIEEKKIEWKKLKMQKQLEMEERKLKLEEDKIRNNFELRKLEIAKEERIAKKELDMKYANK